MKRIVWLASYPKSGNTWFRAFLANLVRNPAEPVDINELDTGGLASARLPLDAVLGFNSADLTAAEIAALRPEWYRRLAAEDGPTLFIKVHDGYTLLPDGRPMFPPEVTKGVIYLVRNPLDVCVSYAHHSGRSEYDKTIKAMGTPGYTVAGRAHRQHEQLPQVMGSWSEHVVSWTNAEGQDVHVMRYEDMKRAPEETFSATARFAGLPSDPERIRKALKFSSFEELSRQESQRGFREKMHAHKPFFRKGKSGSWREELRPDQIQRIIADQQEVMRRLGYLPAPGEVE